MEAFPNADNEFWRGYTAALEDAERAHRVGRITDAWFANVRNKFALRPYEPSVDDALVAKIQDAAVDPSMLTKLDDRIPEDKAREMLQYAARVGRAMPHE